MGQVRVFSEAAFLLVAQKKNKIKPGTKNTDLEGMGPNEKRPAGGNGGPALTAEENINPFRQPQKPTDGGKKKKKKKKKVTNVY